MVMKLILIWFLNFTFFEHFLKLILLLRQDTNYAVLIISVLIYLSIYLSTYLSIYLSIYIYIYLSIYLSIHTYIYI